MCFEALNFRLDRIQDIGHTFFRRCVSVFLPFLFFRFRRLPPCVVFGFDSHVRVCVVSVELTQNAGVVFVIETSITYVLFEFAKELNTAAQNV